MKYEVVIKETEVYALTVEAESQADALIKAEDLLDGSNKYQYHHDSEYEETAQEI